MPLHKEKGEKKIMKKRKRLGVVIILTLILLMVGCSGEENTEESLEADKELISIGIAPYPQIDVMVTILEEAYQELGYSTERVEGDMGFMWLGVSQGDIDVFPDAWLPVLHSNYVQRYEDKLEIGDVLYKNASIGITVPKYMEEINSIKDLKDNAALFDNRIVGIEPSAGVMLTANETLEAYHMQDDIDLLESSTPAMLAEVDTAIRSEEPIAFLGWRPHIMFSKYDLKILEDDKGIWETDNVYVVTASGLEERAPEAYEFAQKLELTVDDIENILAEAEETELSIEEVTKKWFKDNKEALEDILE